MNNDTVIALCADILPVKSLERVSVENEEVFEAVRHCDFSLGNFEMPITDRGVPLQKLLNVRAPSHVASHLGTLGLRAVTLANNHAPDYGWDGICDTMQALATHGIQSLGAGSSIEDATRPLFTSVNGVRIGVVAFSCLTPTGAGAADSRPGISALHVDTAYEIDPWYQMEEPGDPSCIKIRTSVRQADLARATAALRAAKAQCDVLIVTLHWGFGSTEALADYQQPLAHAFIDAGADVVHGHHAHAVQAFEFYKSRPIIYSANVLVGQQVYLEASEQVKAIWRDMSQDGFITFIHFRGRQILSVELRPTVLDSERLPRFAAGPELERIAERIHSLSQQHGAVAAVINGRVVISPGEQDANVSVPNQ